MTYKGKTETVAVPSRLSINNSSAIMATVEADGGIGLVPNFAAASSLAEGRVVQVLKSWSLVAPYAGTVDAVYNPGQHLALKTRAFIDFLVDKLA